MQIILAGLASFGHLGLISDPLIVFKFHNETHDPKGQESKIYTIVKGRERSTTATLSQSPAVVKSNVFLKRLSFGSKECTKELKQECANFLGLISYHLIVSKFHNKTHDPKGQENKSSNTFFICWMISKMAKKWPTPISVYYFIFLFEFFQISFMDCFHKTLVKVWIRVLSDDS